jgi:hypothetical protein
MRHLALLYIVFNCLPRSPITLSPRGPITSGNFRAARASGAAAGANQVDVAALLSR